MKTYIHLKIGVAQFTLQPPVSVLKPCTDVASNLLVIDLRFDVQIACDGLPQKIEHAGYFTCDPLISLPIFIRFPNSFSVFLYFKLSNDSSYNMIRQLPLVAIASNHR